MRGLLHVSGDGLRVVDDETKGLIVDQTIEKVSFCAPDRNHERGFSYICRDGTTRRWMCHGFLAHKDSGERLSHAVGCAFAVCLERKQRRDKECGVTMTFDMKNSTFTRSGSFRQQTMTERLLNNERSVDGGIVAPSMMSVAPLQQQKPFNPFAIERPHATPSMLERQGSFRGLGQLGSTSPFKRQMSLRINDLPSNAERQRAFLDLATPKGGGLRSVSPIPEMTAQQQAQIATDTVSQLCQEMSVELSLLTKNDDLGYAQMLNSAPTSPAGLSNYSLDRNSTSQYVHYTGPAAVFNGNSGGIPANNLVSQTAYSPTNVLANNNNVDSVANNNIVLKSVSPTESSNKLIISPSSRIPSTNGVLSSTSASNSVQQRVRPLEQVNPNNEQWQVEQVQSTTTTTITSPSKRPPSLHSRAKSLTAGGDPFDAEWVAPIVQSDTVHNTNPFISPPKPPAQSFQVQL